MRRSILPVATLALALGAAPPARAQVSGVVRDALTHAPLAGARVSIQSTAVETVTDVNGAFSLPDADGTRLISAALQGYFTGSIGVAAPSSTAEIRLEAVPLEDNPAYEMKGGTYCGQCHAQQAAEWHESAMAHAGTNTWVYDTYDGTGTAGGQGGFVYTRDSAMRVHNTASECRACHQPAAWLQEPFSALGDLANPSEAMLDGVNCDVCHKVADVDETKTNYPGLWPGVVRLTRPAGDWQVNYGVLGDVSYVSPNQMRSAYNPQLKAAVCAACHQDKNDPDNDGDFEEDNGVVSEPTYQEWLASPYADPSAPQYATCVDCHMAPVPASQACHVIFTPYPRPAGDVRSHRFPGTTPEFLENAVSLDVTATLQDGALQVAATVVNDQTGHHVPTGVTIRNMILLVEAWDEADGTPLTEVGAQRVHVLGGVGSPGQGYYAGLPGKLYAKVNHDADMASPVFYTDATGLLFDTRLAPLASDRTGYTFQLPATTSTVGVRARLIYRRSWRALVDAKGWTTDGHGAPLGDIAPPHFGHLMEQAEARYALARCDGAACACVADEDCPEDHTCADSLCLPNGGGTSSSARASSSSTSATTSSSASSSAATTSTSTTSSTLTSASGGTSSATADSPSTAASSRAPPSSATSHGPGMHADAGASAPTPDNRCDCRATTGSTGALPFLAAVGLVWTRRRRRCA